MGSGTFFHWTLQHFPAFKTSHKKMGATDSKYQIFDPGFSEGH